MILHLNDTTENNEKKDTQDIQFYNQTIHGTDFVGHIARLYITKAVTCHFFILFRYIFTECLQYILRNDGKAETYSEKLYSQTV